MIALYGWRPTTNYNRFNLVHRLAHDVQSRSFIRAGDGDSELPADLALKDPRVQICLRAHSRFRHARTGLRAGQSIQSRHSSTISSSEPARTPHHTTDLAHRQCQWCCVVDRCERSNIPDPYAAGFAGDASVLAALSPSSSWSVSKRASRLTVVSFTWASSTMKSTTFSSKIGARSSFTACGFFS